MDGHSSPKNIKIIGAIQNIKLNVLIGRGSTYNFIQDPLVKFLSLQSVHSNQYKVMVGNDEQLSCIMMCSSVPLILNNIPFLPINGVDKVLSVQLLTTLGPILTYHE